jgi:hypothetical protein
MVMNESLQRRMIFTVLALLLAVALASCGSGGGTTAGGGTGGTGVGPVTGFGSVIVNGVHYDDSAIDDTNFFDDHVRTKAGLKVGMMVAIFGSINGTSGRADNIAVLRHVDGPMDDNGVNLATNGLKVMGQDVLVDTSTVFDNGVTNLADLRILQGANVKHPELEVHGSADNNGVIHATFIHKWADDNVAGRSVQVRGAVAGPPTGTTFVVGRKTVNFTGVPGGLPAGVVAGKFVEVKGSIRVSDNVLLATSVKLEDATGGQLSGSRAEVEGYVNRVITQGAGSGSFELLGPNGVQTVTWTTGTTTFTGGAGADILAGDKVEVEGTRKVGGVLAATKIEIRGASNVRMESTVTSVSASSLTIFGKTVMVNALTQYEDSRDGDMLFSQSGPHGVHVGDTLEVSAYLDNSTGATRIIASRVERIDAIGDTDHILQGTVESIVPSGGPGLTILGITVNTFASPGTRFFRADETEFATQADFFAAVAVGDIVKARGNLASPTASMNAVEVQIEPTIDN